MEFISAGASSYPTLSTTDMWYEFESFLITFVLENELKINWSWEKNFHIDSILIIALNLQMTVQASDNRLQPRLTNATVIINVVRGQPPFFLNTPYSTAVNERVAIGTSVYRVSAQDNDLIVSLLVIVVIKSYICDKRSWELAFYIYILICHLTGQHSVQSDWRYPRL